MTWLVIACTKASESIPPACGRPLLDGLLAAAAMKPGPPTATGSEPVVSGTTRSTTHS